MVLGFSIQIVDGLVYLHKKKIMHRDLKPDNIMINEHPLTVKIIDFGTCKDLTIETGPHTSYVSTRWYRAPEVILLDTQYNQSIDIWSLGLILGELMLRTDKYAEPQ